MERQRANLARPSNEGAGGENEGSGEVVNAPFQQNLRMAAAFAAARQAGNEGLEPVRRGDRSNQAGGRGRARVGGGGRGGGGMLAAAGYRLARNNEGPRRNGGPNNVSDASTSDFRSNDTSITSGSRSNDCASSSETRSNEDEDTSPSPSEQDAAEQESKDRRHSSLYYSMANANDQAGHHNHFKNDDGDTRDPDSMSKEAEDGYESESTQVRTNDPDEAFGNSNSKRRSKYSSRPHHSRGAKKRKSSSSYDAGASETHPTEDSQDQASKMSSKPSKKLRKRHKSCVAESKKGHHSNCGLLGDEIESKQRSYYDDDVDLSELSSSDGQSFKASPDEVDDADTTQATTFKSKSTKRSSSHDRKASSNKRKQSRKSSAKSASVIPKPKRPMSAYNFFFREERAKILSTQENEVMPGKVSRKGHKKSNDSDVNAKMSFENMGRMIAARWKSIDPVSLERYTTMAEEDGARYRREMSDYYEKENERRRAILFPGMEQEAFAAIADTMSATRGLASSNAPKLQESITDTQGCSNSSEESASTSRQDNHQGSFLSHLANSAKQNSAQSSQVKTTEVSAFGWNNGMPVLGLSARSKEGPGPETSSSQSEMQSSQSIAETQTQTQASSQTTQLQLLSLLNSMLALQSQNQVQTGQVSQFNLTQGNCESFQKSAPGPNLSSRGSLSAGTVQNVFLGTNSSIGRCAANERKSDLMSSVLTNQNAQSEPSTQTIRGTDAPAQVNGSSNNGGNMQLDPQILQQLLLACQQPSSSTNSSANIAALLLANVLVQGRSAQKQFLPQQQQGPVQPSRVQTHHTQLQQGLGLPRQSQAQQGQGQLHQEPGLLQPRQGQPHQGLMQQAQLQQHHLQQGQGQVQQGLPQQAQLQHHQLQQGQRQVQQVQLQQHQLQQGQGQTQQGQVPQAQQQPPLLTQLLQPQQQRISSGTIQTNLLNSQGQARNQAFLNNLGSSLGQNTLGNLNVAATPQDRRANLDMNDFRNTGTLAASQPQTVSSFNASIVSNSANFQGRQPQIVPQIQQQPPQEGTNLPDLLLPLAFMLQQQQRQSENSSQFPNK